jgi:hypothetical protein
MRADLAILQWLNMEQALVWLKDETGIQLSEPDLLSQCDAGQCAAYLNVDRLKGVCSDWLKDELGEWFSTVYGVGRGQILNPRALIEGGGMSEVQLYIASEVRQIERAEAEVFNDVEWLVTIPPERCHLLFRQSEISELARIIGGVAPPQHSPKPSHLRVVSALIELLMTPGRPIHTQDSIISAIDDRYGPKSSSPVRGLGPSNLEKIFADANKEMLDAKK